MGNWRKLLAEMVANKNPCNYRYEQATRVLGHLGFVEAKNSGTSHRKWRLARPGRPTIIIGLVEGAGPMKKVYILDMVRILQENDLLPDEV